MCQRTTPAPTEAAIRAGYRFVGIELDDHNFGVARDRIRKAKPDNSQNIKPCLARPIHARLARRPHLAGGAA